ncbi:MULTISPECIES: hypothetical protein [Streptomyces]|uniref:hypothetical protein n=1 Tax=Streptomyces TaxID=1883 RepID=UPI000F658AF7|nr:hypothetical protein [Streptomyces alboflavus]
MAVAAPGRPLTGSRRSIRVRELHAFFEDEAAAQSAREAIEKRAEEIGWNSAPHPAPASTTIYDVIRHT